MEVLVVQVFVSLLLVTGGVLALAYSLKQSDHEHADRLSILPLEPDAPAAPTSLASDNDTRNLRGTETDHV